MTGGRAGGGGVISAFVPLTSGDSSQALILLAFHVDHLKWLKRHPAPGVRGRPAQAGGLPISEGVVRRHGSSLGHWDKFQGLFLHQVWWTDGRC